MYFLQQIVQQFFLQITLYNGPEGSGSREVEEVATPSESPDWAAQYPDAILRQADAADREAQWVEWKIHEAIWNLEVAEWTWETAPWDWELVGQGEPWELQETGWEWEVEPVVWETGETQWEVSPEQAQLLELMTPDERENFGELSVEEQGILMDNLHARAGEALFDRAAEIAEELWISWFGEGGEAWEAELQERLDALSPEDRASFEWMTPEEQSEFVRWLYAEEIAVAVEEIQRELTGVEQRIQQWGLWSQQMWALNNRAETLWAMRRSVQGGWRAGPGSSPGNYAGWIGEPLTWEFLEEYGATWHELATWLEQNQFPVYNGQPNYCGQNVGEALNGFGIQWLPSSGRHWYRWSSILAERSSQFRQVETTPQEAPAGAIISYDRNTGGSSARQQYGHVEIALWQGRWFYFGQVASGSGGSNRNPPEGSYTIFMPTSKTPGESPSSSATV